MRIRLKERCFIGGRLCEPGEVVTLAEGQKGPTRSVRTNSDKIDYGTNPPIDANRRIGEVVDVPLYDVVPDKDVPRNPDDQRDAAEAVQHRESAQASKAIQASRGVPEPKPAPAQRFGEVRTLTHTEERDRR